MFAAEGESNEPDQLDALEQCGRLALSQGIREKAGPALAVVEEADLEQPSGGHVVNVNGLNVYGSAVIDGTDRDRLDPICRYLLRGPLALGRLKQRPDGLLTYRLKKPDRRGNTVLVMTPQQLLMRLCRDRCAQLPQRSATLGWEAVRNRANGPLSQGTTGNMNGASGLWGAGDGARRRLGCLPVQTPRQHLLM